MKYFENTCFVLCLIAMWLIALNEYTVGGDTRKLLFVMGYALFFIFMMYSITRTISLFIEWLKFRSDHAQRYAKLTSARNKSNKKEK